MTNTGDEKNRFELIKEVRNWEILPMYFCGPCGMNARVAPTDGKTWGCPGCGKVTNDLMQFERITPTKLNVSGSYVYSVVNDVRPMLEVALVNTPAGMSMEVALKQQAAEFTGPGYVATADVEVDAAGVDMLAMSEGQREAKAEEYGPNLVAKLQLAIETKAAVNDTIRLMKDKAPIGEIESCLRFAQLSAEKLVDHLKEEYDSF